MKTICVVAFGTFLLMSADAHSQASVKIGVLTDLSGPLGKQHSFCAESGRSNFGCVQ